MTAKCGWRPLDAVPTGAKPGVFNSRLPGDVHVIRPRCGEDFTQLGVIAIAATPDGARGQGVASQLLARAEEIARKRGCTHAYTDTFSFQAPQFWARNGWSEAGRLDGMPPGHARIWFQKTL